MSFRPGRDRLSFKSRKNKRFVKIKAKNPRRALGLFYDFFHRRRPCVVY